MLASIQSRTFCLLVCCLKIKVYKTIIFSVVLHFVTLTLRTEDALRVFEERVQKKIFKPRRKEQQDGENYSFGNFVIRKCCLGDGIKKNGIGGASGTHEGEE
jgi:hypothetical protein